jgi:GNAT superfamily N-acetyltransferase
MDRPGSLAPKIASNMPLSNFERMMQVVADVFDTRNDPDQLDVNEAVIERLKKIHPATLSESSDENGPTAWILLIPTTKTLMDQFVREEITERQLFENTLPGDEYDAIYLCSATVLPEYRGKGLAKQLTIDAVNSIRNDHRIQALFVWAFTNEGEMMARSLAALSGLPLLERAGASHAGKS